MPIDDETESENTTECCNCGHRHSTDDSHEIDGEAHCPDCIVDCESCDTIEAIANTTIETTHTNYSRSSVTEQRCESCRFSCADCGDQYGDEMQRYRNASDERICGCCADNYCTCVGCESLHHDEDLNYDEDSGDHYCSDCERSRARENRVLHDYSYHPPANWQYGLGQKPNREALFAGIEVEVDKGDEIDDAIKAAKLHDSESFYCKSDGSLDRGFEIVSHPSTFQWWMEHDYAWAKSVQESGFKSYNTDTCGMHVHVSRLFFSHLDLIKLMAFMRDNADFILRVSRRKTMKHMAQWAGIHQGGRKDHLREVLYRHPTTRGISRESTPHVAHAYGQRREPSRYSALNLCNASTIEFRMFRGTLHIPSIKRNIALVFALCHFIKHNSMVEMTYDGLCRWLKKDGKAYVGGKVSADLLAWFNGQSVPMEI